MKYFWFSIIFLVVLVSAAFGSQTSPLFVIGRSKNANVVCYDAKFGADGKIDPKEPVVAYWLLLAKDGRKQPLGAFDKKAYGFSCAFDKKEGVYRLVIEAFKGREIKIYQNKDKVRAQITINGKPASLKKIFIKETETLFLPKVQSIELFGKDKRTGGKLYEKINV